MSNNAEETIYWYSTKIGLILHGRLEKHTPRIAIMILYNNKDDNMNVGHKMKPVVLANFMDIICTDCSIPHSLLI
jgi:hypothetical protein